jgi:transcriptional regulator with XRE-family HTH domain
MNEDTFANRLKKALDYNNMKPVDLCKKADIDKSLVCNYLKGEFKPKQEKLHEIARILNVSEAWLMGYDKEMNKKSYDTIIKELLDSFLKLNEYQQAIIINLIKNMN